LQRTMAEFIDVAWSMTEVLCLLEVDDICSIVRNDELGSTDNFVATNDEFDGAVPMQGLGFF
jgi:hypothetical protein